MTFLSSDDGARPRPPLTLRREVLGRKIALRRARLAGLETAMIAACEAAALGVHRPARAACDRECWDRERWDRATWHRYLAAAMRLEAEYGPRMRRLRLEIGQLERLMTLPVAA